MTDQPQQHYFTIPQLAQMLGISRIAAYKKVKKGQIAAAQVGRNFAISAKDKEFMSIPQYAKKIGVSRIAVYKRVKKGQIPTVKMGRTFMIPMEYVRNMNKESIKRKNE